MRVSCGKPPQEYRRPTATDRCAAWLLEPLQEAEEPVRPRDVLLETKVLPNSFFRGRLSGGGGPMD